MCRDTHGRKNAPFICEIATATLRIFHGDGCSKGRRILAAGPPSSNVSGINVALDARSLVPTPAEFRFSI